MIMTVSVFSLCILYDVCCRLHDFFASAVVTIGFNTVAYSVLEDGSSVNITVSILNGTLARNVEVTLSTVPGGTAIGEFSYIGHKHSFSSLVKTCFPFYHYSWNRVH